MNNINIGDNTQNSSNLDNDKNKKIIKKDEYKKPIKRKNDMLDDKEGNISNKLKENYINKHKGKGLIQKNVNNNEIVENKKFKETQSLNEDENIDISDYNDEELYQSQDIKNNKFKSIFKKKKNIDSKTKNISKYQIIKNSSIIDEFNISKNFNFEKYNLLYSWDEVNFIIEYVKKRKIKKFIYLAWIKRGNNVQKYHNLEIVKVLILSTASFSTFWFELITSLKDFYLYNCFSFLIIYIWYNLNSIYLDIAFYFNI